MTYLPPETPQAAAAREALYRHWMTADDVAVMLSVSLAEVAQMRRARELLSVWVHEQQVYRFPPFQLHGGRPNAKMPQLLALLTHVSQSGWEWIEWFDSCRTLLMGCRPADLVEQGRFDEVLAAAQQEASQPPGAGW